MSYETSKMPRLITFNGTPSLYCTRVNVFVYKIRTQSVGHKAE